MEEKDIQEIVHNHYKLIFTIAKKIHGKLKVKDSYEDYFQDAIITFYRCMKKYKKDDKRKANWKTFYAKCLYMETYIKITKAFENDNAINAFCSLEDINLDLY